MPVAVRRNGYPRQHTSYFAANADFPVVRIAYEKLPTYGLTIVDRSRTATRHDGTPRAVVRDHFTIVQPDGLDDSVHQWVRGIIGAIEVKRRKADSDYIATCGPGGGKIDKPEWSFQSASGIRRGKDNLYTVMLKRQSPIGNACYHLVVEDDHGNVYAQSSEALPLRRKTVRRKLQISRSSSYPLFLIVMRFSPKDCRKISEKFIEGIGLVDEMDLSSGTDVTPRCKIDRGQTVINCPTK